MAVREYRVEKPSTSQEILDQIAEIAQHRRGTLSLEAEEIGNDLAVRRSPQRRAFTLELANLEFPTTRLSLTAQDTTTKEWVTVYQTAGQELHVQVAE